MRGIRQALTVTVLAAAMALGAGGGAAHAGKFKVLHSFGNETHRDGSNPQSALVMDAAGNFFGTAINGGKEFGTVFELERKENGKFKYKTIYRFCESGICGQSPSGPLIVDTQGNLYGTAKNLVFKLSPRPDQRLWSEQILYRFCSQQNCTDGSGPTTGLTYAGAIVGELFDGQSPLYGTTEAGGANGGGIVFELENTGGVWNETVLYDFCSEGGEKCLDGKVPRSGLLFDAEGNLFGTTFQGGGNNVGNDTNGAGVVFQLTPGDGGIWTQSVLYRFCSLVRCKDGANPEGELLQDAAGTFFGTTLNGFKCAPDELFGCGTVYQLRRNGANWEESILYVFCSQNDCKDGQSPEAGLMLDASGELYGTARFGGGNNIDQFGMGGGVVFSLGNSSYQIVHRFCSLADCADGEYPATELIQDASGALYGATTQGGDFGGSNSGGTVFRQTR